MNLNLKHVHNIDSFECFMKWKCEIKYLICVMVSWVWSAKHLLKKFVRQLKYFLLGRYQVQSHEPQITKSERAEFTQPCNKKQDQYRPVSRLL